MEKLIVSIIILLNFMIINAQPTDKGFVGYSENGRASYIANFFDKESSTQISGLGAEGKTTAEMKKDATYTDAGWDFTNIWMIYRDFFRVEYPTFRESVVGVFEENNSGLPAEYSLDQNYPNPFNPSTVIGFTLPESANVKLLVYNSIGEKVTELINKNIASGNHKVNFDASNLSSGLYFYRIVATNSEASSKDDFMEVKKMLFIK